MRSTLAPLPRNRPRGPSVRRMKARVPRTPPWATAGPRVWKRILVRSSGATADLAMPPAAPPAMSSREKEGRARSRCCRVVAVGGSSGCGCGCCWIASLGLGIRKDARRRGCCRAGWCGGRLRSASGVCGGGGAGNRGRAAPPPAIVVAAASRGLEGRDDRQAGGTGVDGLASAIWVAAGLVLCLLGTTTGGRKKLFALLFSRGGQGEGGAAAALRGCANRSWCW